ncbi:putative integral membrane protein [Rosellinia necatrix]|uniref:Putative integral membrane protein n=1 Tax=Rosellinia necatrix TaxID=77044 RepID=A0A1W2TFN9_ROSNE|nr:putative integral membrane protein [Rosellinia necatrix]
MADSNDQGIRPLSLGLTWTFTILAVITVAARFIIRRRVSKSWAIDDWIMLLALVLQLVYQSFFTILCSWGNGLPYDTLSPEQRMNSSKWGYISAFPSILISAIARISITILLVRIFGVRKWFRYYFYGITSLLTLVAALSIAFLAAQSSPWQGLWMPMLPARRLDPRIYSYTALASQFLNAISDITFVLFPVCIIWNLNMSAQRKVALVTLMCLSTITFGVVLVKIVLIFIRLSSTAIHSINLERYFQSLVHLVAALEQCLVIILGCVPTLKFATKLQFPSFNQMTSWAASLVPGNWSNRSRSQGSSGYGSNSSSAYNDDLELAPKVKLPGEDPDKTVYKITQRKDYSVEYS